MKVVFYSPHAAIWPHAYTEALVAEALQSENMEVYQVGCDKELASWCIPMDYNHLSENSTKEEKDNVCEKCIKNRNLIRNNFKFFYSNIGDFLTTEDLVKIDGILKGANPQNLLNLIIDNINVGRAALYDFTLVHKKLSVNKLSDDDWRLFYPRLRSALISFFAGKSIINKINPDRVIFYSSSYSNLLVVREQADRLGIPTFSIYNGNNWYNRFQRMHISNIDSFSAMISRNELWYNKYHKLPATSVGLESSKDFMNIILSGKSRMVYGGGKPTQNFMELKNKYGIKENQKVLLMALSSYDELVSAEAIGAYPPNFKMTFSTQIEWIKVTLEYIKNRPDLFLVIRVHPRELPNKRDFKSSEHIEELRRILIGALPKNVYVNWPEDNMSLYSWLEVVDLGLTFWSSVGRELALWGLACLTYAPDYCTYPANDLGWICRNKEEYINNIDLAIKDGWSFNRILKAYRWLAFELEGALFDISDAVPAMLKDHTPKWIRGIRKFIDSDFAEKIWFFFHKSPLKLAPLMSKRIATGLDTEGILEPTLSRLDVNAEKIKICEIVNKLAIILWGTNWSKAKSLSPLRNNLKINLERQYLNAQK